MIMPFGKYKGKLVSEIEDKQYLLWAYDNVKLTDELLVAIAEQLQDTKYNDEPYPEDFDPNYIRGLND